MRFVPWPAVGEAFRKGCVVVDALGRGQRRREGPALVLSHHYWPAGTPRHVELRAAPPGSRPTPAPQISEFPWSSTDEVLAWLSSVRGIPAELECVTADHYDIDSALGVWACLQPEAAVKHTALLSKASVIGDFRHGADDTSETGNRALRLACYMNEVERTALGSRPFEGGNDGEKLRAMVAEVLPALFGDDADRIPETDEYTAVTAALETPRVVTKYSECGLCVVRRETPCHYYALFAGTADSDIMVAMYAGNRYEVEHKYTSFVRSARPTLPRVSLGPLAAALNALERRWADAEPDHAWRCDSVTDTGPLLRLDAKRQRVGKASRYDSPAKRIIHASAIPPDVFQETVVAFFRKHLQGQPTSRYFHLHELREINNALDI
ncbi:hypothetical protein DIPPA_01998 [Diplonema papillatum]|nr:hypothetical protein DIPPA_01998 [Diplonema papillatum]